MVVLTLMPYRGNHARSFPHAGFLGLTPVVVQGTVRTVLEEDNKPLKASELIVRVRCYETDLGHRSKSRGGSSKATHVIYEQAEVLWQKNATEEWTDLGESQNTFRITVPIDAANAVSTSTFKNYRSWWQIEAGEYRTICLDGLRAMAHANPGDEQSLYTSDQLCTGQGRSSHT